MATISNNDIAQAIYLELKDKQGPMLSESLKKVISFLSRKKLISKSGVILSSLEKIINKEKGIVKVDIRSAETLTQDTRNNLIRTLTDKYKASEIELNESVDQRLIGGIKIQVEDEVIDLTISNKIKKLQEHLTR